MEARSQTTWIWDGQRLAVRLPLEFSERSEESIKYVDCIKRCTSTHLSDEIAKRYGAGLLILWCFAPRGFESPSRRSVSVEDFDKGFQ